MAARKKVAKKATKKGAPKKKPAPRPSKEVLARRKRDRLRREAIAESIRISEEAHKRKLARDKKAAKEARARRVKRRAEANERAAPRPLIEHLIGALEHMQDTSPVAVRLHVEPSPPGRQLWLLVGEFTPTDPSSYADVHEIFRTWEDDLVLDATIDPQRLSMIKVGYQPVRGKKEWFTVADAGEWNQTISRARMAVDIDLVDSLANKYTDTIVEDIHVYLSQGFAIGNKVEF